MSVLLSSILLSQGLDYLQPVPVFMTQARLTILHSLATNENMHHLGSGLD